MPIPRMLTADSKPFDPLALTEETREIICKGDKRKYTAFYCTGVYGGISTAYTVGCNLRCIFCWVSKSRDSPEKFGEFFSPQAVFEKLTANAERAGVQKLRISGGEPTLCRQHLLALLRLVDETNYFFVLETNGILIGQDKGYAAELCKFKNIYIRVSLKAGNAEGFQRRCGAVGKFFELPFKALQNLRDLQHPCFRAAAMTDPFLMPANERAQLIERLQAIDPRLVANLEEEACDMYDMTKVRLKAAGWL